MVDLGSLERPEPGLPSYRKRGTRMTVIEPARTHLMHSNSWLEPGARGSDEIEWHMWRTRQWPFNFLNPGDTILVVSGGSVDEGRIVSENRIDHLLKADYSSHEQAWELFRDGLPAAERKRLGFGSKQRFLDHEYTQDAPESGWLIAFVSTHLRDIDAPRPEGFKFRPNGWGEHTGVVI
jgi:hypothetical protein